MRGPGRIELDKPTREKLIRLLIRRLRDELDVELAPLDGVRLLDFLSETLGPHYYNQGLYDAQAIIKERAEAIVDAVWAIERPIKS